MCDKKGLRGVKSMRKFVIGISLSLSVFVFACGARDNTDIESTEAVIESSSETESIIETSIVEEINTETTELTQETEENSIDFDIEPAPVTEVEAETLSDENEKIVREGKSKYYDFYENWLNEFMNCTDDSKKIKSDYEDVSYQQCKEGCSFSLIDVNNDGVDELIIGAGEYDGYLAMPNIIVPADTWEKAILGKYDYIYPEKAECVSLDGEYGGEVKFFAFQGNNIKLKEFIIFDYDMDNDKYIDIVYNHADGSIEYLDEVEFMDISDKLRSSVKAIYRLTPENVKEAFR